MAGLVSFSDLPKSRPEEPVPSETFCVQHGKDWLIDYVDGVRLRLWTAATNGPFAYPPGDVRSWSTMAEGCRHGENSWLVHQSALW
jgi:hypothetical protein